MSANVNTVTKPVTITGAGSGISFAVKYK